MGFWPNIAVSPSSLITLNTCHLLSLGGNFGMVAPASANFVFGANGAVFIPFRISKPIIVQNLFVQNGTAVSGNIDLGIYTPGGTRLVSTGSTLQAGANVIQTIAVTPTQLGPGLFYLALAMTSAAIARILVRLYAPTRISSVLGLATMAGAFPLPAVATFATVAVASLLIPQIGLTARAFV